MKTNADNHSKNKSKIANAMAKAKEEWYAKMIVTLSDFLDDAMKDCLAEHNEKHHHHTDDPRNTYGWILIHNSSVVKTSMGFGAEIVEWFDEQLMDEIGFDSGWAGIVIASMLPLKYFKWDYEIGIMNSVIPSFKEKLDKAFEDKRIRK